MPAPIPRALDIDAAQAAMIEHGMAAKAVIEGPPRRACPILLRQTSFKALEEAVHFPGGEGGDAGTHTARFGHRCRAGGDDRTRHGGQGGDRRPAAPRLPDPAA
ncbi:hypothetical protein C7E17_20990, partial [Stenotrophomonas maltophilia]